MNAGAKTHLIIGCGYTGLALARQLVKSGAKVTGTSRSEMRRSEIEATGANFAMLDLDTAKDLPDGPFASVTLLAPPPENLDRAAGRIQFIVGKAGGAPVTVVISTAIFGDIRGTITERTHPSPKDDRQRRFGIMDAATLMMRMDGYDTAVVRTPAIYGPGRDHRAKLLTGEAKVVKPAPPLSRIHVEDLAALLVRMTEPFRPPLLLACDEMPAPTWRVVEEAARLLGVSPPTEVPPDEAPDHFSDIGLSMRLVERSCRSVVRPWLGVRMRYPTYREGLRACLL